MTCTPLAADAHWTFALGGIFVNNTSKMSRMGAWRGYF